MRPSSSASADSSSSSNSSSSSSSGDSVIVGTDSTVDIEKSRRENDKKRNKTKSIFKDKLISIKSTCQNINKRAKNADKWFFVCLIFVQNSFLCVRGTRGVIWSGQFENRRKFHQHRHTQSNGQYKHIPCDITVKKESHRMFDFGQKLKSIENFGNLTELHAHCIFVAVKSEFSVSEGFFSKLFQSKCKHCSPR